MKLIHKYLPFLKNDETEFYISDENGQPTLNIKNGLHESKVKSILDFIVSPFPDRNIAFEILKNNKTNISKFPILFFIDYPINHSQHNQLIQLNKKIHNIFETDNEPHQQSEYISKIFEAINLNELFITSFNTHRKSNEEESQVKQHLLKTLNQLLRISAQKPFVFFFEISNDPYSEDEQIHINQILLNMKKNGCLIIYSLADYGKILNYSQNTLGQHDLFDEYIVNLYGEGNLTEILPTIYQTNFFNTLPSLLKLHLSPKSKFLKKLLRERNPLSFSFIRFSQEQACLFTIKS